MIPYSLNSKDVKKGTCPGCGFKDRFSFYVNNETKEIISYKYGKCDRIENCKYHMIPGKESVKISDNYTPPIPKPILSHPIQLVKQSMSHYDENSFVQFLISIFGYDQAMRTVSKYKIGTSKKWNSAVFWQIDSSNTVHHGKIMSYNISTGKRLKNDYGKPLISSVRAELGLFDYDLKQCLFGLNLVNDSKTIAVVESEKTAAVMDNILPQYTWTSTGSEQGFKYDMLMPVKGKKILAYPDKGCYESWSSKAEELNSFGFDITVSDTLEKHDVDKGSDLADIFINGKQEVKKEVDTFKEIKKYDPSFTWDDYEYCKGIILNEKSDDPKICFDLDGNSITEAQSNMLIKLLDL